MGCSSSSTLRPLKKFMTTKERNKREDTKCPWGGAGPPSSSCSSSDAFPSSAQSRRLSEWGKTGFLYARAATVLQKELEATHHWDGLVRTDLVSAYSEARTPEHTITPFRKTDAGITG